MTERERNTGAGGQEGALERKHTHNQLASLWIALCSALCVCLCPPAHFGTTAKSEGEKREEEERGVQTERGREGRAVGREGTERGGVKEQELRTSEIYKN